MKLDNNVFDILKTRLVVNVSIFITSKIVLSVSTHTKKEKNQKTFKSLFQDQNKKVKKCSNNPNKKKTQIVHILATIRKQKPSTQNKALLIRNNKRYLSAKKIEMKTDLMSA